MDHRHGPFVQVLSARSKGALVARDVTAWFKAVIVYVASLQWLSTLFPLFNQVFCMTLWQMELLLSHLDPARLSAGLVLGNKCRQAICRRVPGKKCRQAICRRYDSCKLSVHCWHSLCFLLFVCVCPCRRISVFWCMAHLYQVL